MRGAGKNFIRVFNQIADSFEFILVCFADSNSLLTLATQLVNKFGLPEQHWIFLIGDNFFLLADKVKKSEHLNFSSCARP